jgi:hypothetical protein
LAEGLADGLAEGLADGTAAGDGEGVGVVLDSLAVRAGVSVTAGASVTAGLPVVAAPAATGVTESSALAVDTPVIARPSAMTIVVIEARVLFMTCSWVWEIYVGSRQGALEEFLFHASGRSRACDADVGGVSSAG